MTVCGLTGDSELVVALDPSVEGVTAEVVDGAFEHQLTFAGGVRLRLRPRLHRESAHGVIALRMPPSTTITFVQCYAKWLRPDGEVCQLEGGTLVWIAG